MNSLLSKSGCGRALGWIPAAALLACGAVRPAAAAEAVTPVLPVDAEAVAKIARLGANEAALIGEARVVGDFNETARRWRLHETGPRGRDFSIRMVWAPERRRALFCGANHAVPHRLNDVWEFDLASMCWALLYAPDHPRDYTGLGEDFSDVVFRDGVLVTRRGGPAIIGHTWWGLTYDPERRRLLFMNTWVTKRREAVRQVGGDPDRLYEGPPLWAFSPNRREWRFLKAAPPRPRAIFGGMLEHVGTLGGTVWHANNWQMRKTWLYEADTNTWRDLQANGGEEAFAAEAPQPEQVGYHDPARGILVVHRHRSTHHYDIAANCWKKVLDHDDGSPLAPWGHDAHSPFYHDPASGHGLLVEFKTGSIWSYNPDYPCWTKLQPAGDPMPEGRKRLAYFDPARGVLVVLRDTTVWAYRYTRAK